MLTTAISHFAESPTPMTLAAASTADFLFHAMLAATIAVGVLAFGFTFAERDAARRHDVLGLSLEATLAIGAAALAIRLVAWMCGIGYHPFALGQAAQIMLATAAALTLANAGQWVLSAPLTDDAHPYQQNTND
ncbi:MAG: hypothetical protein C0482_16135 [Gordonia sp.]|nr:hypothetical protein [Gordonia sp. (in: high G+C Gram-positive bacteria)]